MDLDGIKKQLQKQLLLLSSKPNHHSPAQKAMEIKVALLLVSALIAVAAAYPYKDQQQATAATLNCNWRKRHRLVIGSDTFKI